MVFDLWKIQKIVCIYSSSEHNHTFAKKIPTIWTQSIYWFLRYHVNHFEKHRFEKNAFEVLGTVSVKIIVFTINLLIRVHIRVLYAEKSR